MNRKLQLYRSFGTQRIPVTLIIDDQDNILSETTGHEPQPVEAPKVAQPLTAAAVLDARKARLVRQGIKFREEGNTIIIESVPPEFQRIMSFFSAAPCWFPECEELRRQYREELEALGGPDCPDCQQGSLIRKYTDIIEDLLRPKA